MTHRIDVARGRDLVARWCALAEQRLEYLTEMFESGRWRRYHSELAFLENIQEAKTAVETWRGLSTREAAPDNSAIDIVLARRVHAGAGIAARSGHRARAAARLPAGTGRSISCDRSASSAPVDRSRRRWSRRSNEPLELCCDAELRIEQRYPLLRNAL